ncbi:hypothetical protein B0T21DRAFT_353645 [Apiosordaria backusii]|uniref:Uncharacterized protein n=1 Tax=Apiosordaria backusii TaxID=314023 RepID=A0AA39ZPX9_9PEZI|nr:hypothetical protein B0T21DRAFT_353645 [Apiosordaria backusii]
MAESASGSIPYAFPDKNSYHLLVPFYAPSNERGSVWAVAMDDRSGTIFASALTTMFTLIFGYIWILIVTIVVWFEGDKRLRRYVALLTLWNIDKPWNACKEMAQYAWACFWGDSSKKPNRGRDWRELFYGLTVAALALLVTLSSLAVSIYVPSLMQLDNMAPANADVLYYPDAARDAEQIINQFGVKVPPVMRALGSATIARDQILKKVTITSSPSSPPDSSQTLNPSFQMGWNYSLTGADFGFQHAPGLGLTIVGSCTTEYGWLSPEDSFPGINETYRLWGGEVNVTVFSDRSAITLTPVGTFTGHPSNGNRANTDGNLTFAVTIGSVHRASLNPGNDPWYLTQPRPEPNSTFPPAEHNASYWIQPSRPVLSCWEQRLWSYKGNTTVRSNGTATLTRPDLSPPLVRVLRTALANPMLLTVGIHSGDSSLLCRTTSSRGVIDASKCSIYSDMERLILASYVSTVNIFTDTTLFPPSSSTTYPNTFRFNTTTNSHEPGTADFVVRSPDVRTFSMVGIIIVSVALATLFLLRFVAARLLEGGCLGHHNVWRRMQVLSAPQLFRNLFEGTHEPRTHEDFWPCDRVYPVGRDDREFKLVECGAVRKECVGHVDKPHLKGS